MNYWQTFTTEYPGGGDTQPARTAWNALMPEDKPLVIEGLRKWNLSEEWKEEHGRFIPAPDRFIKSEKWKRTPNNYKETFKPNEAPKPLTQDELFARRHITSEAAYTMYKRAQRIDTWTKEKGLKL